MRTTRSPRSSNEDTVSAVRLPPSRWYGAALVMPVIAIVVFVADKQRREDSRLLQPVATMGAYVQAECIVVRRRHKAPSDEMEITYGFIATGHVEPAEGDRQAQTSPRFTMKEARKFLTRGECEAALPAIQAARAPRPIWFERDHPRMARTSLEEPSHPELLLIGLLGMPFAAIGWLRRQRQRRTLKGRRAG